MPEQPNNIQELYDHRRRDYQRAITNVAHFAFVEVLDGTYSNEQRARLARIAIRLNDLDGAAGNIMPRNIIPESAPTIVETADDKENSGVQHTSEEQPILVQTETQNESDFIVVNIPRTDELKMPKKVEKKLQEPAEISLRDKVRAVMKLLRRMQVDLRTDAVDFPISPDAASHKNNPIKATTQELIRLGYSTRSEIQSNQMDLYALVTMLLLRGNAANLISGINDGKKVLGTEVAARNAIVDEVNNWLVEAWYAEE